MQMPRLLGLGVSEHGKTTLPLNNSPTDCFKSAEFAWLGAGGACLLDSASFN